MMLLLWCSSCGAPPTILHYPMTLYTDLRAARWSARRGPCLEIRCLCAAVVFVVLSVCLSVRLEPCSPWLCSRTHGRAGGQTQRRPKATTGTRHLRISSVSAARHQSVKLGWLAGWLPCSPARRGFLAAFLLGCDSRLGLLRCWSFGQDVGALLS